ncbi:bifunctional diaminohydroxyphosphoribosylaminopyrimidine deaminase/5-amino-6-(5-phosphoribosylamino)uracil reductase RibD [Endozoicomonas sp. OPT23]|uniref:bifunctional diaminohydroxyphosphoribosylaminopyrimidine deaminase/5-amino-6-(5-phosphoribosylamino)uracil reductase RibD n=1 Tax=Endozoicomonas sp. OPT23 TaxID=2072845 RepID=UPI00351BE069
MFTVSTNDHEWMAKALRLARKGLYSTMPNPRVGCVIVRDGEIVGKGFHERAGEGHAEVHALKMAGDKAEGATAYVTLEPCSYFGRTPPCASALIKSKISRVVAAMEDPNPSVSGRGMKMLNEAGIETLSGVLEAEAKALNPGFIKRMESGRPFVRAKLAMSLDGRTAMASGKSQWITGPDARSQVQQMRAESCAIITGVGSILQDDSSLTVRASELGLDNADEIAKRQPLRVVLDAHLQTPTTAKVISGNGSCLIVCAVDADHGKIRMIRDAGAEVLQMDSHDGKINIEQLLEHLAQREINQVLLETGATLAGAFLEQNLIDELVVFMAPVLMGSSARPLLNLPIEQMSDKVSLTIKEVRSVGNDWKITAVPSQAVTSGL